MNSLTVTTPITRNPDLVATDMDGDTVMMSIERGHYYGISGVGTRVWELLADTTCIADIARAVCVEFDVYETTCETDMQKFIDDLIHNGLVSTA